MCNNVVCIAGIISGMKERHESVTRLYDAARRINPEISSQADLARALNTSSQRINNWEESARGVSKEGALEAEEVFGCSAVWILTGRDTLRSRDWPFPAIDERKVRKLSEDNAIRIETALMGLAYAMKIDIRVDNPEDAHTGS